MLDPKEEGFTPEEVNKEVNEDKEEETKEESQESQEPENIGEDYEPPVRQKSEIDNLYEQAEQEKRMKRVEFQIRKLTEENQKLKSELGYDVKAPKQYIPEYEEPSWLIDEMTNEFPENVLASVERRERLREVKDFVTENPDYKPFEKIISKFVDHPAYLDVPVDFIASAVMAKKAEMVGAKKALSAQEKAKMSTLGGSPATQKVASKVDYSFDNMSNEEFEKELAKVKRSR